MKIGSAIAVLCFVASTSQADVFVRGVLKVDAASGEASVFDVESNLELPLFTKGARYVEDPANDGAKVSFLGKLLQASSGDLEYHIDKGEEFPEPVDKKGGSKLFLTGTLDNDASGVGIVRESGTQQVYYMTLHDGSVYVTPKEMIGTYVYVYGRLEFSGGKATVFTPRLNWRGKMTLCSGYDAEIPEDVAEPVEALLPEVFGWNPHWVDEFWK